MSLGFPAWAAPQFTLSTFPLFKGFQKTAGLVPLRVSVSNFGPDAVGVVHVHSSGFEMDYPVELPESSSKDLTVYGNTGEEFFGTTVELRTNQGKLIKEVDPAGMTSSPGDYFLEIGGNPGDLSFLDGSSTGSARVAPEDAPDRVMAYDGCNLIFLGSGAERLSDEAVKALKLYVLKGGLLVFPGGVATPLLTDGRWQGILPVAPGQPRTEKGDSLLRDIAAIRSDKGKELAAPIGPYSVIDFKPLKGTKVAKQDGESLLASRNYGLGKALFLGFDPLHGALRDWAGLGQFFRRTAHYALPQEQAVLHRAWESGETLTDANDPFQVSLPSSGSIGAILFAYLLCVIPLNFYILKRLGKRHWGWGSSSVISLIFASIMLSQASELYGIPTSHSDEVVVIGQRGFEQASAIGSSKLFASKGGTYDLKMAGLDSLMPASFSYGDSEEAMGMFAPMDVGEIQLNQAQFRNLGFGEMKFEQKIDSSLMPTIVRAGQNYVITAKNQLIDVCLLTPKGSHFLGDLQAGGSVKALVAKGDGKGLPESLHNYRLTVTPWVEGGECVLIATAPDLPVGPTLGKKLPPRPTLVFFAGEDL